VAEVFRPAQRLAAVLVAALLVLLAGCGAEPRIRPVTGGSEGRVGAISLTDAMFDYQGPVGGGAVYRPGDTVSMQATIVNEGNLPDRLVSVSSPIAGGGVVDGDASIPGHHTLAAGYTKPVAAITLPDTTPIDLRLTDLKTEIRAGLTYPVVFTFARAGQLQLQLRVDNPDEPREPCPLPPNGRPPLVFTAPVGQAPPPPTPAPPGCSTIFERRPQLIDVSARVDGEYNEVVLRFDPGGEVPFASIDKIDDGKVRVPDSNDRVQLAGKQALRVSVAPAELGDVAKKSLRPDLPAIAEVRVLGTSSSGETILGIGISGAGDVAAEVDNTRTRTIIRIKLPPYPPTTKSECGSVILEPEHKPLRTFESEASGIKATGTSCDVARDVAGFAAGHITQPYDTPTGYSCRIEDRDKGPVRLVDYTCQRADAQVSFTVS
jgi:hypothetical protein